MRALHDGITCVQPDCLSWSYAQACHYALEGNSRVPHVPQEGAQKADAKQYLQTTFAAPCAYIGFIEVGLISHDMLDDGWRLEDLIQGVGDAIPEAETTLSKLAKA